MPSDYDIVDKPSHYNCLGEKDENGRSLFEPIKVIESWGLDEGFCLGSAIKYILRAPHKGQEIQDLEKALWYLSRFSVGTQLPRGIEKGDNFLEPLAIADAWKLSQSLMLALEHIVLGNPGGAAACVARELNELKCVQSIVEVEDERILAEVEQKLVHDKYAGQADHEAAGWRPDDDGVG
jgi:hypothetical protein